MHSNAPHIKSQCGGSNPIIYVRTCQLGLPSSDQVQDQHWEYALMVVDLRLIGSYRKKPQASIVSRLSVPEHSKTFLKTNQRIKFHLYLGFVTPRHRVQIVTMTWVMVCVHVCRAREGVVSQGARAVPVQAGRQEGEVHLSASWAHGQHHRLL